MDPSRFAVEMDFHKRRVALRDKRRERDNLRHSSKLHEEEAVDETTAFILRCLNENERGDAKLFLNIFKDAYVYDNSEGSRGEFYRWNEHQWIADREKYRIHDIEEVALLYERTAELVNDKSTQSLLLGRAKALRSSRRCHSVFNFVEAEVPFKGTWDYSPYLLPCQNGIVDLRSGELLKNTPERYIRSICPTSYSKGASSDVFDQFLNDITLGNKEVEFFLQKALGCCLIGDPKEEKIFIFFGERGRNGKGSLLQTCEKVLGRYARTFPSEMLLLQRNAPSSSAASPELANLQGVRLAIFSEIDRKRHIDAAKVKNLSGRDTIPCRRLFSNVDLAIAPTHTMIIQTNHKPKAPSDDEALWKRMVVVPFKAEFVEKPKLSHQRELKPTIKERLIQEREAILAWLVEGARRYLAEGLEIPASVHNETQLYRDENDGISAFIEQCCIVDPTLSTPSGKFRNAIKEFCQDEGYEVPSEREIKSALDGRFFQRKTNKGRIWVGIGIQLTGSVDDEGE
jgi:putative DNA primase/helicase